MIKIKYNKFVTKQKIKKLYVLILHYEWVTYTPGADPGFFPGGVSWHNVAEKYFGSVGGSYGGGFEN